MRSRLIAAVVVLVACSGCASAPAVKNPAVERYQRGAARPAPKTSLLDRFRSGLFRDDETARDVTAALPEAKPAAAPVVLVPQIKSDLVLPAAADEDEHPGGETD
jgi:hypothetical protein